MTGEPEFSRPVRLDTLGTAPHTIAIEADVAERAALAVRFGLVGLDRLSASAAIRREAEAVIAEGRISARVVQTCVATAEPVRATIDEPFVLRFLSEDLQEGDDELELSASDCDVVFYRGGAIDLGEAVAETLVLALDPFPRSAGADAVLREAGVRSEEEAVLESSPFAKLKGLLKE